MNAALPSIQDDFASNTWSSWRHSQKQPLTPPMTSTFQPAHLNHHPPSPQQARMTLPPIAQLEMNISAMPPLTPPDDASPARYSPRLPPINDIAPPPRAAERVKTEDVFQTKPTSASDEPYLVDWLDFARSRSAHFIAEKTCEMICYLWFASPLSTRSSTTAPAQKPSLTSSPSVSPSSPSRSPQFLSSSPTTLQLVATPVFVQFMQKLLETTQLSQSVIVLSLHYIYRLKARNQSTPAQPGSEFRIAVAALMMANKFLDDNTYTNKTWSEVSGIDLVEINKMEREFLLGVDHNLYVDKSTYESWLNLLKGLVMAKEKDSRRFRKPRPAVRPSRYAYASTPTSNHSNSNANTTHSHSRSYPSKYRVSSHRARARSTSPVQSSRYLGPFPCHTSYTNSYYSNANGNGYDYHRNSTLATTTTSAAATTTLDHYDQYRDSSHSLNPCRTYNNDNHSYSRSPVFAEGYSPNGHSMGGGDLRDDARSGSKRSAAAAFSPTTASFSYIPAKRPVAISVTIPGPEFASTSSSQESSHGLSAPNSCAHSPLEGLGLHAFAKMSLDGSSNYNVGSMDASAGSSRTTSPQLAGPDGQQQQHPAYPTGNGATHASHSQIHGHGLPSGTGSSGISHNRAVTNPVSASTSTASSSSSCSSSPWTPSGTSSKRRGMPVREECVPETLVTAYEFDQARRSSVPQNLYFYSLACSPMEGEPEWNRPHHHPSQNSHNSSGHGHGDARDGSRQQSPSQLHATRNKKGKLRYHQPKISNAGGAAAAAAEYSAHPSGSSSQSRYPAGHPYGGHGRPPASYLPTVVQSASTSPHDVNMELAPAFASLAHSSPKAFLTSVAGGYHQDQERHGGQILPHFHDTVWTRPAVHIQQQYPAGDGQGANVNGHANAPPPPPPVTAPAATSAHHYPHSQRPLPPLSSSSSLSPYHQPSSTSHRRHQHQAQGQSQTPVRHGGATASDPSSPTMRERLSRDHVYRSAPTAAPFANAGPPGVHFYPTPLQRAAAVHGYGYSQTQPAATQAQQQHEYGYGYTSVRSTTGTTSYPATGAGTTTTGVTGDCSCGAAHGHGHPSQVSHWASTRAR